MNYSYPAFFLILASPLISFLFHCTLARRLHKVPAQRLAFLCCLSGTVFSTYLAFCIDFFILNIFDHPILLSVASCLLLNHLYFHIFNMSETARRVKILIDIYLGKTFKEGTKEEQMIETRLQRLLKLQKIEEKEGRIYFRYSFFSLITRLIYFYESILFPSRSSIRD